MRRTLGVEPPLLVSRIAGLFAGEAFRPRNWCVGSILDIDDATIVNAAKAIIVTECLVADATSKVDAIRQLRADSPNERLAVRCRRTQC